MSDSEETETEVTETEVTETEESETDATESGETEYEPLSEDVDKLVTICGASRRDATAALKRTKGKLRDAAAQLMDHTEEAANPVPSEYGSPRSTARDPFLDDRRVVLLSTVFLIPPESAKVALTVANYNIHLAETLIIKQMDLTKRGPKRRWSCCKRGGRGTRPPAPRTRATATTDATTGEASASEAPDSTELTETTETTETETETTETGTTETETTETETTESETEDTDEDEEDEESKD